MEISIRTRDFCRGMEGDVERGEFSDVHAILAGGRERRNPRERERRCLQKTTGTLELATPTASYQRHQMSECDYESYLCMCTRGSEKYEWVEVGAWNVVQILRSLVLCMENLYK